MVDISVGSAIALYKVGKEALTHLRNRVKDTEDIKQLMALQDAFQGLLDENDRLHKEILTLKDRKEIRKLYHRKKVGSGVVLVKTGEGDEPDGPPLLS